MVCSEQAPFSGANYYNGSLFPFPADQFIDMMDDQCWYGDTILATSGFSEVQMNAIYNVTENTQTDALAGFLNHNPLRTDPLIDLLEVKKYDSSVENSGLPFYWPQESSGNGVPVLDDFVQLSQWMPKEEPITFMDTEWQQAESPAFPVQPVNVNGTHAYLSNVKGEADAPETLRSVSRTNRERSKEAESRRRYIIRERVQALQDLLPPALKDKRGNQESIVHDVIGHIKYLQLQLKELSRSRLGGDSSSGPLKFDEGYGQCQPHEQMFGESLEEILGTLLEENPAPARKIFESKGLCMVPMASINALLCNKG